MWRQRTCRVGAASAAIGALSILAPVAAATAWTAPPHPSSVAPPTRAAGATIATIIATARARSAPRAGRVVWHAQPQTDWTGEPQSLLVLGSAIRGDRLWLRVLLPIRPDGRAAWIPRSRVTLSRTRYWLVVAKRRRRVQVYVDGRLRDNFRAVIGKPATPTPTAWPRSTSATGSRMPTASSARGRCR